MHVATATAFTTTATVSATTDRLRQSRSPHVLRLPDFGRLFNAGWLRGGLVQRRVRLGRWGKRVHGIGDAALTAHAA